MPFTAAHVLAVLPGVHARRALHLDATCLVIGSMAPDVEYFVRGVQVSRFGHSLIGVVAWGVPITLALAVVFHGLVKWPALLAGPRALTALAAPWRTRWTAGAIVAAIVSAALGDLTHVVWDGATHSDGLIVKQLPALARPYHLPVLGDMVLHRILQHASSLVGLAGVAAYVLWRLRRAPRSTIDVPRGRARLVFGLGIAAGIAAALVRLPHALRGDLGNQVVAIISGALAGAIVASLALRRSAHRYQAVVAARAPRTA